MPEIAFHADATAEMRAAAGYYEEQQQGLGEEFLDEIEQGLSRVQEFPRLWPIYEADYRRYLLRRFPFGIIYRVDQEIYVIAVAHLHREPGYWYARR
jgi:plasmid stabilization system protein ParE